MGDDTGRPKLVWVAHFFIEAGVCVAVWLIVALAVGTLIGWDNPNAGIGGGDYRLGMGYGAAIERALVLGPSASKGTAEVPQNFSNFHPLCDHAALDEARARASRGEEISCAVFKERFDEVTCRRMNELSCAILEFHPSLLNDPLIHALITDVLWRPCDFLPLAYERRRDDLACDSSSSVGRRIVLRADQEQEVVDVRMRPKGLTRGPVLP